MVRNEIPRPRELSPSQRAALARMRAAGGALHRWPGGFWTDAPPPAGAFFVPGSKVPAWHVTLATVRSLEQRGLAVVAERQSESRFAIKYVLTPDGLALAEEVAA
jgi:hypothetical protein